jgi:hypothetical protein
VGPQLYRNGRGVGGGLEPRTAIEGLFSAWGGLGKPDRGLGRGETFFPDIGSDRDSGETFQISRNLGLVHVEFICLLDSQPCTAMEVIIMYVDISNDFCLVGQHKSRLWIGSLVALFNHCF